MVKRARQVPGTEEMTEPRTLAHAASLVAVAALMTFSLAMPAAAEVSCTGTIGAETIDGTVVVPDGASCTLDGTTVDGNVLVG